MTLTGALNAAASGLAANARRAEAVSDNIANALTPGYSARTVTLAASATGGVEAGLAERQADPALSAARMGEEGRWSAATVLSETTAEIAQLFGQPGDTGGLSPLIQSLENALLAAAERPEIQGNLLALQGAAADVVTGFNKAAEGLLALRGTTDAQIGDTVTVVNRALQDIETLNRQIMLARSMRSPTAALEDRRQQAIDTVNAALPVHMIKRSNGAVALVAANGVFLVDETAKSLEFARAGTVDAFSSQANGALSGLAIDGKPLDPARIGTGSLAALMDLRDAVLPRALGDLDALALDLAGRFQDLSVDATLAPGGAGLFTDAGAPADPAQAVGLAGRLSLSSQLAADGSTAWRLRAGLQATAPGDAGEDTNLRSMLAALRSARTAGNLGVSGSASELSAAAAGSWAARAGSAEDRRATTAAAFELLQQAEAGALGVDSDSEMQLLLALEKGYAANAKVLAAVDGLLEILLEI